MKKIFLAVCLCLADKDDKVCYFFFLCLLFSATFNSLSWLLCQVVANAIRSISHASYFLYSQDFFSVTDSSAIDLFRDLIEQLSAKINFSLDDAVGGAPRGLTWKQRNGAKKQMRGSCTTLGVLLNYSNPLQGIRHQLLEIPLSSLFRCIQLSSHVDEKIVATAISSLLRLPNALWKRMSGKCDSIGSGLVALFGYLGKVSQ